MNQSTGSAETEGSPFTFSIVGALLQREDSSQTWHVNLLGRHYDVELRNDSLEILGGTAWERPRKKLEFKPVPAPVVTAILNHLFKTGRPEPAAEQRISQR